MKIFPATLALLAPCLALPTPAAGGFAGYLAKDDASKARLTCALVQRFGPSRSRHKLKIRITKSPFGPLAVSMDKSMKLRVSLSFRRYPRPPAAAEQARIRTWIIAQLPAQPRPCKLLIGKRGLLRWVQHPAKPPVALLSAAKHVTAQLELFEQARARKDPDAWRWADGAVSSYQTMSKKERRALGRTSLAIRRAVYAVVRHPAPRGLSRLGRRSYCRWYRKVRRLWPPKRRSEGRVLRRARTRLGCR